MTRLILRAAPVVLSLLLIVGAVAPSSASAAPEATQDYVVHARTTDAAEAAAAELGVEPTRTYDHAFAGFAASLTESQVKRLKAESGVIGVERDRQIRALDPNQRHQLAEDVQPDPPNWGLDRIDQRTLPLDRQYNVKATGAGVTVWVLDTGVDATHPKFGGRAKMVANTVDDIDGDCDGHGTVVAGIAAAQDYGVAEQAQIRSVKVLDCTGAGTLSSLLAGIDYVATHREGPSVAVMSWSYGPSDVLLSAVSRLVDEGVFVASSAGNSGADDCAVAPRAVPGVLVVANSTIEDQRHPTSSTGSCVDIYAPGTSIRSTVPGGGIAPYSGTSMAAPHAVGVAALYKQVHGDVPSAEIERWIIDHATPDVIAGGAVGGTPNLLLNTGGL